MKALTELEIDRNILNVMNSIEEISIVNLMLNGEVFKDSLYKQEQSKDVHYYLFYLIYGIV